MNLQVTLKNCTLNDIGELMVEYASDDDALENLFRAVKKFRGDIWLAVKNEFSYVCYFYEDSKNAFIANLARRCIRKNESVDVFEDIMRATDGNLDGLELKHETLDHYVVFTPDAYTQGRFRYTAFDSNGFFEHCIRNSYAEVLREAIACHYTINVTGKLEAMFESEFFE